MANGRHGWNGSGSSWTPGGSPRSSPLSEAAPPPVRNRLGRVRYREAKKNRIATTFAGSADFRSDPASWTTPASASLATSSKSRGPTPCSLPDAALKTCAGPTSSNRGLAASAPENDGTHPCVRRSASRDGLKTLPCQAKRVALLMNSALARVNSEVRALSSAAPVRQPASNAGVALRGTCLRTNPIREPNARFPPCLRRMRSTLSCSMTEPREETKLPRNSKQTS